MIEGLKQYLNIATFANTTSEKHAIGIGGFVGFAGGLAGGKDAAWMFVILAAIAIGGREVDIGHLKDVKNEPAYALVASVVVFLVTVFVIIPRLPGGI